MDVPGGHGYSHTSRVAYDKTGFFRPHRAAVPALIIINLSTTLTGRKNTHLNNNEGENKEGLEFSCIVLK